MPPAPPPGRMLAFGVVAVEVSGAPMALWWRVPLQVGMELLGMGVTACVLVWQVMKANVASKGRSEGAAAIEDVCC